MQVSMERTIGTVCGGLLGLGISLLGHGFGQDSDMVFTGDTLPALLHGVRATQYPADYSCALPKPVQISQAYSPGTRFCGNELRCLDVPGTSQQGSLCCKQHPAPICAGQKCLST